MLSDVIHGSLTAIGTSDSIDKNRFMIIDITMIDETGTELSNISY
jgi:hypothetical protein